LAVEELITRLLEHLHGRVGGPMTFRLILQPSMAALFAIRAGVRDGRAGRPAYGWAILTDPAYRRALLDEGGRAVAKIFVLAIIIDVVYQVMELHWFYPLETLIVAVLLAIVPYLLIRGPVGRITRALQTGMRT
jgi:hypothetical protein